MSVDVIILKSILVTSYPLGTTGAFPGDKATGA